MTTKKAIATSSSKSNNDEKQKNEVLNTKKTQIIKISDETERDLHALKSSKYAAGIYHDNPRVTVAAHFESILKILVLKEIKPLNIDDQEAEYLGVFCLKDMKANSRKYHLYYSKLADKHVNRELIRSHFNRKNNLHMTKDFTTGPTLSALTLFDSIRRQFRAQKWNAQGNTFEIDKSFDEYKMMQAIDEQQLQAEYKIINYILFLRKLSY